MGRQVTLLNADRLLGAAYLYTDPISLLHQIRKTYVNTSPGPNFDLLRYKLSPNVGIDGEPLLARNRNQSRTLTRERGFRGHLLRSYRETYPGDYTADQISLQLDDIFQLIQRYFPSSKKNPELFDDLLFLFPVVSDELLKRENGEVKVRFETIFDWNGYINKIDMNILIGAYLAQYYDERSRDTDLSLYYPPVDNVRLEKQLHNAISENHAHLNAAGYVVELNWDAFLQLGLSSKALKNYVIDGSLNELGDRYSLDEQVDLLRATKCLRALLMTYQPAVQDRLKKFEDSSIEHIRRVLSEYLFFPNALFEDIDTSDEKRKTPSTFIERINHISNEYRHVGSLESLDIIRSERLFWMDCFKNLLESERENEYYRLILNTYTVCSNYLKHGLIQSNRGNGFDHFTDAENVKASFLDAYDDSNTTNYESVFEKYTVRPSAKKIELRIAPKNSAKLVKMIRQLDKARKKVETYHKEKKDNLVPPDYGLIVHFIKPVQTYRIFESRREAYQEMLNQFDSQASELEGFMTKQNWQHFSSRVVGIDTANLEFKNPPELFSDLFRRFKPLKRKSNFHFTYHVGESFNTLMDGMRHIFEVYWRLQFGRGDRLGHALALGIDPQKFYEVQRQLLVTDRQSYLDNIAWMYWMIKEYGNEEETQQLNFLETDFNSHKAWFEDTTRCTVPIQDYIDFYLMRGTNLSYLVEDVYHSQIESDLDTDCLQGLKPILLTKRPEYIKKFDPLYINVGNEVIEDAIFNAKAAQLYIAYMRDHEVYRAGHETQTDRINDTLLQIMTCVQRILQRLISDAGISIEANPSSNLKIGYDHFYGELPFLRLNRHGLKENDTLDIPLSINTDDGAIFQTSLAYEYELIAKSLIVAGESPETVYDYIKHLQEGSLRQSFVPDSCADQD